MYRLDKAQKTDYPALIEIWESSVTSTHHFLGKDDIQFYRRTILENDVFDKVKLTTVKDKNNLIVGFMGVSGDTIEMIFLHPDYIGKGIGKLLLSYAVNDLQAFKVDVNEQNVTALKVYEYFGFKVVSRSEVDGTGKPFPILHMQRCIES